MSAIAHHRTLGSLGQAAEIGRSFSASSPASRSFTGNLGKEQSGTEFGKAEPVGGHQRDRRGGIFFKAF